MSFRIALRNLNRNRWRSALTMGGIAVAMTLVIWTNGLTDAMLMRMVASATSLDVGEIQVHRTDYVDEPLLYHAFDDITSKLEDVRAVQGVSLATARIYTYGLLGHEKRSQVAKIVGVNPSLESKGFTLSSGIVEGHWLKDTPPPEDAPRPVVLGRGLLEQLGAALGDELVLFMNGADGSMGDELVKIVGVVTAARADIDRMGAYMHMADVQRVAALDGRAHEISVRIHKNQEPSDVASRIQDALNTDGKEDAHALTVRPWTEVLPEIHQVVSFSENQKVVIYFIIFLIAALGIFNAQRMSALERRREFGVLLAVGLSPRKMFGMVVTEAALLTFAGGLVGAGLGAAAAFYFSVYGLDIGAMSGTDGGLTYMGVSLGEALYFDLTPELFLEPLVIIVCVGAAAGLWPAFGASRLDAVRAIAGRT